VVLDPYQAFLIAVSPQLDADAFFEDVLPTCFSFFWDSVYINQSVSQSAFVIAVDWTRNVDGRVFLTDFIAELSPNRFETSVGRIKPNSNRIRIPRRRFHSHFCLRLRTLQLTVTDILSASVYSSGFVSCIVSMQGGRRGGGDVLTGSGQPSTQLQGYPFLRLHNCSSARSRATRERDNGASVTWRVITLVWWPSTAGRNDLKGEEGRDGAGCELAVADTDSMPACRWRAIHRHTVAHVVFASLTSSWRHSGTFLYSAGDERADDRRGGCGGLEAWSTCR